MEVFLHFESTLVNGGRWETRAVFAVSGQVGLSLGDWHQPEGAVALACGLLQAAQVCDHYQSHYQVLLGLT
jgi:hypothetical protein